MAKAKKIVLGVAIALVAVIVIALGVVFFALNGVVKTAVETVLPQITGTDVELQTVRISPFSGDAELSGFIIRNPEGFKTPDAFNLESVHVKIKLASLFTDTIVIEDITIIGPKITYEMDLPPKPSNIGTIQNNVEAFAGPAGEKPAEETTPAEAKPGKKIQINHFKLEGAQISLSAKLLQGTAIPVPLPTIELHDIGKEEGGTSIGEAAKEIFGSVTGSIEKAVASGKEQLMKGLQSLKEQGGKALEAGKEGVTGAIEAGKEGVGGAVESGKKALEGLNPFKKDE